MDQRAYLINCHSWLAGYSQMDFELQALNEEDVKIREERTLKKEYRSIGAIALKRRQSPVNRDKIQKSVSSYKQRSQKALCVPVVGVTSSKRTSKP